ncbi:hypothetical protein [Alkaliphilus crotonatoxidans]
MEMEKKDTSYEMGDLGEIKEELILLSIEMNSLLLECKKQGILNESEYNNLVKVKKDFIQINQADLKSI